jgi:hypothetical protein
VFEGDGVSRHPKLMEMIALFRKRYPEVSPGNLTGEGFMATRDGGCYRSSTRKS